MSIGPKCTRCHTRTPFFSSFTGIGKRFICKRCGERLTVPSPYLLFGLVLLLGAASLGLVFNERSEIAALLFGTLIVVPVIFYVFTPIRVNR
ncbi:hypothetical protein NYR55_14180 [Sphingomonas sp. BGYR3]|uniref:hypothetical protein n=1 Tax=Sphingomonas sp. BGYR3 TaxID=2975483 RepID=UPI0021A58B1A|nr:hypothetical protein [Sphingomonas sp. BGYR3]MDG5489768.1 hypothetical protein [Sphingomonas sp. BGYR3]